MHRIADPLLAAADHLSSTGQTSWAILVLMVFPLCAVAGALWVWGTARGHDSVQKLPALCLTLGMATAALPLLAMLAWALQDTDARAAFFSALSTL